MKYFVCSDIHNYYSLWMKKLKDVGWERDNPEHKIILCGDLFDRNKEEAIDCYNFALEMCKQGKMIYITGNHEDLMDELLYKGYVQSHDRSNGTEDTLYQLAGAHCLQRNWRGSMYDMAYEDACEKVRPLWKELQQYMIDYYEIDKYIFCHSWIPTGAEAQSEGYEDVPILYQPYVDVYNPNWRKAGKYDWQEARWVNPYMMAMKGLNKTKKTIVSGHWHSSYGWAIKEERSEFDADARFDIFYDKKNHFIGIDACTAHSRQVNILVLEEGDEG